MRSNVKMGCDATLDLFAFFPCDALFSLAELFFFFSTGKKKDHAKFEIICLLVQHRRRLSLAQASRFLRRGSVDFLHFLLILVFEHKLVLILVLIVCGPLLQTLLLLFLRCASKKNEEQGLEGKEKKTQSKSMEAEPSFEKETYSTTKYS